MVKTIGVWILMTVLCASAFGDAAEWPMFRGVKAAGVVEDATTPVTWNVPDSKSVAWKTAIPGLGHSSPIVSGNRIFLTTAVNTEGEAILKVGLYGDIKPAEEQVPHEFKVIAVDRKSGEIVWDQTAHTGIPKVKRHPKASHASSTPVTDGTHVIAFFGSEGLYCYDIEGELVWKKDLGLLDSGFFMAPSAQWGFASSPIIHEGRLIVQCDVQQDSFLAALEVETGEEIWRTSRNDVPTWSTPNVYSHDGKQHIVVNGWKHIGAYDFETGAETWKLVGGGDIPVPTPILAHNLIYITNAHGRLAPVYAIHPSATGDISLADDSDRNADIAWSVSRDGGYMQTPIVYGDYLYVCRDNGVLVCYNARTGERIYREKLGEPGMGFSASGVAAGGKLYYSSEPGEVFVVKTGHDFEVLAQNSMGDECMATPAIAGDALLFRTHHYLIAIESGDE